MKTGPNADLQGVRSFKDSGSSTGNLRNESTRRDFCALAVSLMNRFERTAGHYVETLALKTGTKAQIFKVSGSPRLQVGLRCFDRQMET